VSRVTPIADIIEQMDAGLDRAVLRCLEKRIGKQMAIQKPELLFFLNRMGFGGRLSHETFERQVRRVIVEMRNDKELLGEGILICSSSGGGGYYLAANMIEFDEFIEQEYRGRIRELQGTVDVMTKAAMDRWGSGVQMGLF